MCRANSQGESLGTTGRLLITYDAGIKKDGSYSWSAFLGIRVDRRDYTKMLDVNTARNGMALGKAGTSWDKLGQDGTGIVTMIQGMRIILFFYNFSILADNGS